MAKKSKKETPVTFGQPAAGATVAAPTEKKARKARAKKKSATTSFQRGYRLGQKHAQRIEADENFMIGYNLAKQHAAQVAQGGSK